MSDESAQQTWVETWARHIEALGLSPVALLLFETTHAFGFLGSQALLLAQPLMNHIVGGTTLERTANLLESPELQDRLKVCLEREEG